MLRYGRFKNFASVYIPVQCRSSKNVEMFKNKYNKEIAFVVNN